MTPLVSLALRLQQAATPEAARQVAREALDQGASPPDVAAALTEWGALYEGAVQVFYIGQDVTQ